MSQTSDRVREIRRAALEHMISRDVERVTILDPGGKIIFSFYPENWVVKLEDGVNNAVLTFHELEDEDDDET